MFVKLLCLACAVLLASLLAHAIGYENVAVIALGTAWGNEWYAGTRKRQG